MPRLSDISSKPTVVQFAQGAAQSAVQPVADFLAPAVDVATATGRYKVYTEKNRFRIPKTERATGGRATELRFESTDATYNCQPHALDFPVDNLEQLEAAAMENALQEAATAVAEVAGLAHEKDVIDKALVAAGAGTNKTWNFSADPVDDIDSAVLSVIAAAAYGSAMGVGVLFGAGAWRIFKNAEKVRNKFVVANGAKGGVGFAVPTMDSVAGLFVGNPETRVSYMVYDTEPEGKTASYSFLLNNNVLIFARKPQPTRRDPSFMKTFRLAGQWMKPGSYDRDDGRVQVAKYDWSEDVEVTNSAAVIRLNIS